MKRIRKRILAAALAAVIVITMPGTASYALEENGQTEYISDISTEPEAVNATEEPEIKTDDIEKPETEDGVTEEPETEAGDTEEKETDTEETAEEEPNSISKENTEDTEQGNTGAQDAGTNLCAHHKEHTQDCGYSKASEDWEGSPCTYECRICPIEELIAALPNKVTEDNAEKVRSQLNKILALYRELTAEEQEQIDLMRCYDLQAALDEANAPVTVDGHAEQQEGDEASVEIGGNITYYRSISDAWTAAKGNTATVTLLANANASSLYIETGDNITFNGGAYTLKFLGFNVQDGGELTITGGTVNANDWVCVAVSDGRLTVTGGTIDATYRSEGIGINVFGSGTVQISGNAVIKGQQYGVNCEDEACDIEISGGTITGFENAVFIAASIADKRAVSDLLENYGGTTGTHYAFYQNGAPVTSGLDSSSLPGGTYTVAECTHVYTEQSYSHVKGTLTHTQTCGACGAVEEVDCEYTGFGETYNIKVCACGATLTASLTDADGLVYNGTEHRLDGVTFTVDGTTPRDVKVVKTYTGNKDAGTATLALIDVDGVFWGILLLEFAIAKATPVVTWNGGSEQTLTYTGQAAVTADVQLVNNETGTVSYSYAKQGSDSYISGLPTDVGTYSVKAAFAEQKNYVAAEAELKLTINQAEGTLTVPDTSINKKYGEADFSLGCSTNGDGEISYVCDNENAVTVSADGMVQIKGLGEATVTVSLAEGRNYTAAEERTVTITVCMGENAPNMPDGVMNVPDSCLKVGDVPLPEKWEWRAEDRDKPLQDETAVEAVAVYTGADKDNFETVTATVAVTSHKAGDDVFCTGAGEKEPTCTEAGLGHRECVTCHAVVQSGIVAEALGHDHIGSVTKEPTTSEEGEMTYTCSRCGDTYIEPIPVKIPEGLWISGLTRSVPYTGSAVKPEGFSVYHGSTLLREKTEYTISYKSNTNAGTAQLIVTGKGNYKGKCTAEFTIEPIDLTADSGISATIATVTETGKNLKPAVTVTWNGKKLKEKKDYTLFYEPDIKNASEEGYAVTISGKGNYTGSIERRFYVKPRGTKLLNSAKVTGIKKSYEYCDGQNGGQYDEQNALPKGLKADLKNITVKIGTTTTLTQDTDYTVRVENGNAVGTGYVVIEPTQMSDYAGEKRISFNITGTNIKKCFITGLEKSYPYTGQPIMPEIQVYTGKNGTGTQIPSDAYTVSYSNYTNQGKATVTVTGLPEKGCSGSVKATYSIGKLDLAAEKETGSITVTMPDGIKYAKGGAKPQPVIIHSDNGVIRILREGVDYTLKYSNNTAKYSTPSGSTSTGSAKIPTLKITGIGNYTGTITENYDINVQDIGQLEITVTDKAYNSKKKGSYYYSVPKVYDFDGKLLKSGKDYTVNYINDATGQEIGKTDTVENDTQIRVTVTAKENSNYEGTLSRTYLVRDVKDVKDISKVKYDKIAAQQYTGSSIEPEVKLYTLTGKTKNYLTEEDYEIIGYYNNIKRGTATVLIRGTGAYSGVKSITFKITSADNKLIWFGIF